MFTATMTLLISSGSVAVMSNSFYVNNLVASVQKRPLLALLREWREGNPSRDEIELLTDLIREVESGRFDG